MNVNPDDWGGSSNLEEAVTSTWDDINNLKCQIRSLLEAMEMEGKIENVETLSLIQEKSLKEGEISNREVRLEKRKSENKLSRKRKSFLEDIGEHKAEMDESLDEMEFRILEKSMKYSIKEDSIFFVPVLDKCVFGMTLINVANKKLNSPLISLSLIKSGSAKQNDNEYQITSPFLYNVGVYVKDLSYEKVDGASYYSNSKTSEIRFQNTFLECMGEPGQVIIMPGCEVLVSANFQFPLDLFESFNSCSLLVTVHLNGQQLWCKRIEFNSLYFGAENFDLMFKNHHCDIITALGDVHRTFKLERSLPYDVKNKTLKNGLENFLLPLGFECIQSQKTGIDTQMDTYTTRQHSMFWGIRFKFENCSKKLNVIHCLISTRSVDQMALIFSSFQSWLRNEVQQEQRNGRGNIPKVSSILPKSSKTFVNRIESELQRILQLRDAKSVLRRERELRKSSMSRDINFDTGSIDSNWIHEYISCVTKTDKIFIERMEK